MTTIVYREGILASDTRAYLGDSSPIGVKQKIFAAEDGTLIGISTPQPGLSEQIAAWMTAPQDEKADLIPQTNELNFQVLEITPDGQVYYYSGSLSPSGPLMGPWFVIGSGADYAIGALHMGATAEEAVEAAMEYDAWTGGDVVRMRLASYPEALAA